MIADLRERYRPGETYTAVIKGYDAEHEKLTVSVKEAEPHPFDGADTRHPIRSRRASVITGKYKGGVFCKLEENLYKAISKVQMRNIAQLNEDGFQ